MEKYCDCHMKHSSKIDDHDKKLSEYHNDHKEMWEAIKKKVSSAWLFALVPAFCIWVGFQFAIYTTIKDVQAQVAVTNKTVEMHMKQDHK